MQMSWKRQSLCVFVLVMGIGLVARLSLAWGLYGNYDMGSYDLVAEILRRGGNVYAETSRYNYSPLWMGVLTATSTIANWLSLPHHAILRTVLTGVDLANAILIALIAGNRQFRLRTFALYWLNPGVILIVGYHGQFECLALFFLLLALWTQNTARSVFLGGAAVLVKHIVLFNAWVLFVYHLNYRRAIIAILILGLIVILSFVPFLPEGAEGVLRNVFLYRSGNIGTYRGLGSAVGIVLFYALMVLSPVFWKRQNFNLVQATAYTALLQLTLMPGVSAQYFLLPIAFTSIMPSLWKWTLALGVILGTHYVLGVSLFIAWIFSSIFLISTLWLHMRRRTKMHSQTDVEAYSGQT